jgi:hypothetical protein
MVSSRAQRGVSNHAAGPPGRPSFETPAFGGLLRMREIKIIN